MELVRKQESRVVRPLRVLVPLIKDVLANGKRAADEAGKPYYRTAGELLHEAKDSGKMSVRELADWSKRQFDIGRAQTLLYMSYADATSHLSAQDEHPSLHQHRKDRGMRQTVYPQSWHAPINEEIKKVNIEALKQDALDKQKERALQRKLALSLIDIGFKALASKLHPDKGGSDEAMRRLNRVRKILQEAVTA